MTENLREMGSMASGVLEEMLEHLGRYLACVDDRVYLPYGTLPAVQLFPTADNTLTDGRLPSSRLTCDLALGYLAVYRRTGDERYLQTAYGMLRHAFSMQAATGCFVWNYAQWEIDQVDLGTVLDVYYYFWTRCKDLPDDIREGIIDSTRRAIGYLKTVEQPNYPGIIQKRAGDPDHPDARRSADYLTIDVLNGNALASTAYCRGAAILGDDSLYDDAARYQDNLVTRFSTHVPGWWVYVERLNDREMLSPETILYQAMTALYLQPLYEARPNDELGAVLTEALKSIEADVRPDGSFDWGHEKNKGFIETQLLMWPSAAASLSRLYDATERGLARVKFVAERLVDESGLLCNEKGEHHQGEVADELRQIWAVSDLALIVLFSEGVG